VYAVTPYPKRLNELEVAFLEGNGFTVTGLDAIPCDDTVAIREIPSRRIAELALKNRAAAQKADAVFLACTNLHTMDQIEMLEAELGRPVLSSNLSTLWAAFDKMGIPAARGIGGKLLSRLAQH
jgi:maleate isomerase